MSLLWNALLTVLLACTLMTSIRVAVVGFQHLPARPIWRVITHDYWAASLFVILPGIVGDFARRDISPLPWTAFAVSARRHGVLDGIYAITLVLIAELWLLWIPAQSYIQNRPALDQRTVFLLRSLNLAVGLLLLTPWNPVYSFLDIFFTLMTKHSP